MGTCTLANSKDPAEMLHKAAFHQGLRCLLKQIQSPETEIHHFKEILNGNSLKYKMDNFIIIVSIYME